MRVLVCDDHPLTARMVASIVDADPELELVGLHTDPRQAVAAAAADHADVVVMDLDFEGSDVDGIDATAELTRVLPGARVLILTAHRDLPYPMIASEAALIIDTRNALAPLRAENIVRL